MREVPKKTKYADLVLKRGLVTMGSELGLWCVNSIQNFNSIPVLRKVITLQLLNEKAIPQMAWTFHDAWPFKWDISGFHAQESKIVVESISIKYNYFAVVPLGIPNF